LKYSKNSFFTSIWIVFPILLISYSIYILLKSPDLAPHLKPYPDQIVPYVSFKMILGLFFLIAILSLGKIQNNKFWLFVIIVTGLISRVILIPSVPVLEDDYYRYLWDGAVTAHGYNPYIYSPFDAIGMNDSDVPDALHNLSAESGEIIKNINHPHIRTIYPLLSQITFAAAYLISPWEYWGWKVLLFIFDLLLLVGLLKTLKHLQLPLFFITIYWLNPIVIHEFFNSGHMDLPALLFVAVSLFLLLKQRMMLSVICLALAVGFKLWPIVLLPLILRNVWRDRKALIRLSGIFAVIVFILFLPVLLSGLDDSLGFIKYAGKWINNSAFYTIYQWLVQEFVTLSQINVSCLSCINRWGIFIIYVVLCAFILKKRPETNLQFLNMAFLIVAALFLISPTQFPWYYTWMVPLLVIRPKVSLLIYPLLLPLYQLQYLGGYIVYIEHIPILILFMLEMKGVIWKDQFNFINIKKGLEINTP
jgi:hypothetical protein